MHAFESGAMSQRLYTTEISSLFAADATFGNDTGLIVALPGRGMLPFLMIPEGYPLLRCVHTLNNTRKAARVLASYKK